MTKPEDVLHFWFVEHGADDWFMGGDTFDAKCAERLGGIHARAARAELWRWRETPHGRLAEIILLDQLSRQLFRGRPEAFACDKMAVSLAQEAVYGGLDAEFDKDEKAFLYLPFEHAESLPIQEESVRLFKTLDDEEYLQFAIDHKETIERFGRFPFRNAALGRKSTPEEVAYMNERDGKVF
jgi:uncharacterized protein (DUF924 family)